MENRFSQNCCCSVPLGPCDLCTAGTCGFVTKQGTWDLDAGTWTGTLTRPYMVAHYSDALFDYPDENRSQINLTMVFTGGGKAYCTLDDETNISGTPTIDGKFSFLGIEVKSVSGDAGVKQIFLVVGWSTVNVINNPPSFTEYRRVLIGCINTAISEFSPLSIAVNIAPNYFNENAFGVPVQHGFHEITVPLFNARLSLPIVNPSGRVSNQNTFGFYTHEGIPGYASIVLNKTCYSLSGCLCPPSVPLTCLINTSRGYDEGCLIPRVPYPPTVTVKLPTFVHHGPTCVGLCTLLSNKTFSLPMNVTGGIPPHSSTNGNACIVYSLSLLTQQWNCTRVVKMYYHLGINLFMIEVANFEKWQWQGDLGTELMKECLCDIKTKVLSELAKDPGIVCTAIGVPAISLPAGYLYQ